jgi:hypothetical protein
MKFERKKISALTGNTEVHFSLDSSDFKIIADQSGIRLRGESPTLYENEELQSFAKAVSDAFKDHLKLKPKLVSTLSGH